MNAKNNQINFFSSIENPRLVCWFSCGATSAVACKMAISEIKDMDVAIVYTNTASEHPDNKRFLKDCEQWFQHPITILNSKKYRDVDDVIINGRYINGPSGAKCTQELKINVRKKFQRPETDLQVFGFDAGEADRAAMFKVRFPNVKTYFPLLRANLFKNDCLAILREVGIELPAMYRLGYKNNNCIGCVKGGMGYWNKIRKDFPNHFKKRAEQERIIGRSCIKGTFLDELRLDQGNYTEENEIECSDLCNDLVNNFESCEI